MIGGNISIVGKPNVGKSTLFNLLVQKHLAGATRKPQTTRHTIDGVLEEENAKYQFIDTPGLNFNIKKNFNRVLNKNALSAIYQSNLILHLVKYNQINKDDIKVLENIKNLELPKILVLNKIDLIRDKNRLMDILSKIPSEISDYYDEIIPVSSKSSKNIDILKQIIKKSLSKSKKNSIESLSNRRPIEFFTA